MKKEIFTTTDYSKKDGTFGIKDGQGRFVGARALKLPVFYHFSAQSSQTHAATLEDISRANSGQRPWLPKHYVHSFAVRGNKDFIKLQAFIDEFHLPVTTSATLLAGKSGGGSVASSLKVGAFNVKSEARAYKVAGVIVALKRLIPFATDRPMVMAIQHLMQVHGFDPQRMLHKIETQRTQMVKCANTMQYIALIETIYNYRARPAQMLSLKIEVQKHLSHGLKRSSGGQFIGAE